MMRRKFIPLAIIFFLMYAALAWIYGWSANAAASPGFAAFYS